jgi:hypothetical protein
MRTLRYFVVSAAAGTFLLYTACPLRAQSAHEPTDLERRFARHFPEKPPVRLEFVAVDPEHRSPLITNLYQYSLTAYAVHTGPTADSDITNTFIHDALTRTALLAPIPRGLSQFIELPQARGLVPDAKLVAAVWEDGSTFGSDELLARISNSRKALVDSYDLAIAALQAGLEKNWTAAEYLLAAQQLKPPMPAQTATVEEAKAASEKLIAQGIPSHTITNNMQRLAQENRPTTRVAKLAQTLLKSFEQSRDSLRQALIGLTPSADRPVNR